MNSVEEHKKYVRGLKKRAFEGAIKAALKAKENQPPISDYAKTEIKMDIQASTFSPKWGQFDEELLFGSTKWEYDKESLVFRPKNVPTKVFTLKMRRLDENTKKGVDMLEGVPPNKKLGDVIV